MRNALLVINFTILLMCTSVSTYAQSDDGALVVSVRVPLADTVAGRTRTWRSYVQLPGLRVQYTADNRSSNPLRLSPERLQAAFRFRVTGTEEIPVTVQWAEETYFDHGARTTVLPIGQVIELGPGQAVGWDVVMVRRDKQPFTEGMYNVEYSLSGVPGAIAKADGSAWKGRTQDGGKWELTVAVLLPTSPEEAAREHTLVAHEAFERGLFEEAFLAYAAAETTDPTQHPGRLGMAASFMRLGRYGDAIPLFRQMTDENPGDRTALYLLATAFAATGQNGEAEAALRRSGRQDAEVKLEMSRILEELASASESSRPAR